MLRNRLRGTFFAAALVGLAMAQATSAWADTAPAPPGTTASTQPMTASAGTSAQPGSTATVSTGKTSAAGSGSGGTVGHCGVAAGAGSNGYSAQPAQAGTSGTSTPTDCSAAAAAAAVPAQPSTGPAADPHQGSVYVGSPSNAGQGAGTGSAAPTGGTSEPTIHDGETGKGIRSTLGQSGMLWGVGNTSPANALLAWLGWLLALLLLAALLFVLFIIPVLRRRKKPDVQRPRVA